MRFLTSIPLLLLLLTLTTSQSQLLAQNVPITEDLLNRLSTTNLINQDEVLDRLNLVKSKKKGHFTLANPYYPNTIVHRDSMKVVPVATNGQLPFKELAKNKLKFFQQKAVYVWKYLTSQKEKDEQVCGCKFMDSKKVDYKLKTFKNVEELEQLNYFITHQGHCGACSSLKDLAILLGEADMVKEGRRCGLILNPQKKLECHKELGLSDLCAEAWTYNAIHTFKRCRNICMKEYGLVNVMRRDFPKEYVNEDGSLKPCLQCDELKQGPGYHYVTGRTRRSSGIYSEIKRLSGEVYPVDFRRYYAEFGLGIENEQAEK